MSHFTTIQTQIRDIRALADACRELGLTLVSNTDARGYSQNKIKGDYVIKLNGPYDIAVNHQEDGTYGFTCDWWAGHVEREVGKAYGKLLQLYGVYKTQIEVRKKGLTVRRQPLADGSIKLCIGGL